MTGAKEEVGGAPVSGTQGPWLIVLSGAIGCCFTAGIFLVYVFGVFGEAMRERLGTDQAAIGSGVALGLFSLGFSSLLLGPLIARFGIRAPTVSMLALFGLSMVALGLPWATPFSFFITMFILGTTGAAASAMPYAIAITGFFNRRRGLAFGLMLTGGGVGATLGPHAARFLLENFDLSTSLSIAAAAFTLPAIVGLLLFVPTPRGVIMQSGDSKGMEFWGAHLKDRCFWLIMGAVAGNSAAVLGIAANLMSMLSERGFAPGLAAWALSIAGLSSWVGRFGSGLMMDRVFAPWVGVGLFVLAAMGAALIAVGGNAASIFAGAALLGLCLGAEADLLAYLVGRYFPIGAVSRILGIGYVAWSWGGGIGAWLANFIYRFGAGYGLSYFVFIALLLASAGLLMALPSYPRLSSRDRPELPDDPWVSSAVIEAKHAGG